MGERRHTRVTLVKIPKVLAEMIEGHESGTELGYIEEKEGEDVFRVNVGIGPGNFPREWKIQKLEEKSGLFTFLQKNQGAYIDGIVTDEIYIRPDITPEYLRYKKEREEAFGTKKEVQAVDSLREGIRMEKYGTSEYDLMARRRRKLLLDKKRERLPKSEVMNIMFKAFEEYPYWSVKDLADRSGQPQAYIQELLPDIAIMNKKTYRNMYELKPEYKNNDKR